MLPIILLIIAIFFLYLVPGIFLVKRLKLSNLALVSVFSLVTNTLLWFWLLYFFPKNLLLFIWIYLMLIVIFFWKKKKFFNLDCFADFSQVSDKVEIAVFVTILLLVFSAAILVYIPLVKPIYFAGYKFFRFPGVGGAMKHLFVTASLKQSGVPPVNPYFPSGHLSYYYGFYILPAVISLFSKVDFKTAFLIHYLISIFLYLSIVFQITKFWLDKKISRIFALVFLRLVLVGILFPPFFSQGLPLALI